MIHEKATRTLVLFLGLALLPGASGCVATRNWVRDEISPVTERIAGAERATAQAEHKAEQARQSAERALFGLGHLRLEKRFVLDFREGANFDFDSAALGDDARRAIDGLLADLEGVEQLLFLVAGHTDGAGSEDYNYELGRKRVAGVARYLITHKAIDPFRVATVSYGESAPVADNATRDGRRKNRRVEVLVYRQRIAAGPQGEEDPGP